jgi:hypothetical protein
MLEEAEIRAIASNIVQKAKDVARVRDGTLKRSIASTYVRGVVIFRQRFYGVYGDNSQLEELAKKYMPFGIPYKIELTTTGNKTVEVSRSKTGRRSQRSAIASASRSSSSNIKRLITSIKKKKDGKKEKE